MRHPRTLAVASLAAVALLASGCADTTRPGTAAYVGSDTISVDTLQAQVDDVLAYRTGAGAIEGTDVRTNLPLVTQQVLSQDVLHELVADAVARTGFTVDEDAVAGQVAQLDAETLLAQPGQAYLTPDTLPVLVRDQVVLSQLGQRAWDGLAVTVDLVPAANRSDAETAATEMAVGDDASTAVVARAKAAGQQAESGVMLSPSQIGGAQSAAAGLLATPLFAAPQGSAIALSLAGGAGQAGQAPAEQWFAMRIVSRSTDAAASKEAGATTAADAPIGNALSLGLSLLPELAGRPEVRLNPRYGKYDETTAQVIAESDVPASVVVRG